MAKVSDLIARFLGDKGMAHVFGIIGAGDAHIFDSIAGVGMSEIVCTHHEQAACMAMQTYYRTSGIVTACILTTGAGSTNGVTGVVSAWMDSIPGMIISGNEHSRFATDNPLRIWGTQGYDSAEMVKGVTKYATRVLDASQILYELEKAYHIATTGRPGPVWVDVPMDIQATQIDEAKLARYTPPAVEAPALAADARATLDLLKAAKRPVLWLGHGIRLAGAADKVEPLIDAIQAPALVSWAAIDMVASDHPLVYGRAGVYGQRSANFVLQNADLIVAIGTRLAIPQIGYVLDELARDAKLVVVDIDETEVRKHGERVALPIVGDAGAFIDAVMDEVARTGAPEPQPEWIAQCDRYRADYPWIGPEHDDKPPFINSYRFMDGLLDYLKPDQIIVTDMGTALLSGHQVLKIKTGQRLMTSTGLGEMGYGLPAAIGASFGRDRGEVMCLNCDGGMMMNLQELQTMVHHQLPIKLFIFNNDGYLMIKHTQTNLFAGRSVAVDKKSGVTCPDYSRLAAAFDIPAYQIHTWEDRDRVLPLVQAAEGPVICEVFMDPMQLFVPKLSLAIKPDGSIVSPPLEDLSPLISREALAEAMIVGVHPKSAGLA